MTSLTDRFSAMKLLPSDTDAGLVNSWPFLIPLGLICVVMLLARAWGFV